jgi:hypothetical protein
MGVRQGTFLPPKKPPKQESMYTPASVVLSSSLKLTPEKKVDRHNIVMTEIRKMKKILSFK